MNASTASEPGHAFSISLKICFGNPMMSDFVNTEFIPSSCGIIVYMDLTSIETRVRVRVN